MFWSISAIEGQKLNQSNSVSKEYLPSNSSTILLIIVQEAKQVSHTNCLVNQNEMDSPSQDVLHRNNVYNIHIEHVFY